MIINVSKIAFIYYRLFFRIGTFQWVTSDSNKKIPSRLRLCEFLVGACRSPSYSPRRAPPKPEFDPATRKDITLIPRFSNELYGPLPRIRFGRFLAPKSKTQWLACALDRLQDCRRAKPRLRAGLIRLGRSPSPRSICQSWQQRLESFGCSGAITLLVPYQTEGTCAEIDCDQCEASSIDMRASH